MSITGIESAAADTGKSLASGKKLAENFDTFLVMLTTQLKHQDPLSPMDSTQFTNQLVQFANVEQQIAANSNLEKLIAGNALSQRAWSISYIGQTVEAVTNNLPLQGATESESNTLNHVEGSKENLIYTLPSAAKTVTVAIKDADGNTVRTITGAASIGRHEMEWDGTNATGTAAPDGIYTFKVTALDSAGNEIAVKQATYTSPGSASFSYTLAEEAKSAAVVIRNAAGTIVRNLPARGEQGRHEMQWDGKDGAGRMMQDGAYKVEVVALDGEGKSIESGVTVYGRVTDVAADGNETLLNMGGVVTTLSNVLTVRESASLSKAN